VSLLFWEQGLHLRDYVTGPDTERRQRRFTVYPDAAFALHVAGEDKGRAFYFLELDRGTMPVRAQGDRSDIVGKLYGYRYYRERKLHSRRYAYRMLADGTVGGLVIREQGTAPRDVAITTVMPVPGFNVLFVVPGSSVAGPTSPRTRNILTAMQEMGSSFTTSSLFWFATPTSYSVNQPLTVFDPIWSTSRIELGLQSLIE
jgi:hypothetical protein